MLELPEDCMSFIFNLVIDAAQHGARMNIKVSAAWHIFNQAVMPQIRG